VAVAIGLGVTETVGEGVGETVAMAVGGVSVAVGTGDDVAVTGTVAADVGEEPVAAGNWLSAGAADPTPPQAARARTSHIWRIR
jgi:hypothetical protein